MYVCLCLCVWEHEKPIIFLCFGRIQQEPVDFFSDKRIRVECCLKNVLIMLNGYQGCFWTLLCCFEQKFGYLVSLLFFELTAGSLDRVDFS